MSLDDQALKDHYRGHPIDLSWLNKPSQHVFRWRTNDNRWLTAKRRVRDHASFLKAIGMSAPRDVYVSTASWLNPIDLPRLRDNPEHYPVLLDHFVVFDIDVAPFSIENLTKAQSISCELMGWLEKHENLILRSVSFSGSKGFHLIYDDPDREAFALPDLKEREMAVKAQRKALLNRVVEAGFEVDTKVTADLAMALILAAARRLSEAQSFVRQGQWKTWDPMGHIGQDLKGKTLGIVGLGRIGAAVAQRCVRGWDMRLVHTSTSSKPSHVIDLGAIKVDFETLLEVSDIVSVHCPLRPETRGLFNADAFKRMRQTAVFVNTARGEIHDQDALELALREGPIFAAGLDVTVPEPLQAPHPLLNLHNCIVLPHMGSATTQSRNGMARIAAHNLLAGLKGQALPHPVG